jgi:O-acetyl-ADP-ribose deacetylase (regulator of RNase III)
VSSRTFGDVVVECVQGDITDQPDVDAVVCAANADLAPGGGVAGAIHRVAGSELYAECRSLAPIATGEAVITSGHGLPNAWCIHTLGPVFRSDADPPARLAACYRSICARADELALVSVATPAISTGIFGYPVEEAASVALRTVAEVAPDLRTVRLVRFVLWDAADLRTHATVLEGI